MNSRRISELAELEFDVWKLNPSVFDGRSWSIDMSIREMLVKNRVPFIQMRSTFEKVWKELELLWLESVLKEWRNSGGEWRTFYTTDGRHYACLRNSSHVCHYREYGGDGEPRPVFRVAT